MFMILFAGALSVTSKILGREGGGVFMIQVGPGEPGACFIENVRWEGRIPMRVILLWL
jgi:hypothetical protein